MADQYVGPDAQGNYALIRDGVVISTWNGLTQFSGLGAARGRTSTFDASGTPVPAQGQPIIETPPAASGGGVVVPPATEAIAAAPQGDWFAPAPKRGGRSEGGYTRSGGGGYAPIDDTAGMSLGGDSWLDAPPAGFGGTVNPFDNIPNYQNGMRHPAAGGAPLTPGGAFNDGESGGARQMTQYDTGASAGPNGVQSPRSDTPSDYQISNVQRMHGYSPPTSPSGGGGGHHADVRGMISQIKSNVMSKVGGMFGGGSSGSSSGSYDTTSSAKYRRQGKRLDKASDKYYDELADPDPLPVHGWSKQQGFKPGTIEAVLGDPTLVLNSAIPGYESKGGFGRDQIESLPMTDLAMMMYGAQKDGGLSTKTPIVKPPPILKRLGDVKPEKPDEKRTLDPAAVANKVAAMWQQLNEPGHVEGVPFMDSHTLLNNLATADRGSILRQNLRTQFEEDPNAAMQSVASYLRSAMSVGRHSFAQEAALKDIDRQITNMGGDLLRMKPKKASGILPQLAQEYLYG